jgi:hypothetical protein
LRILFENYICLYLLSLIKALKIIQTIYQENNIYKKINNKIYILKLQSNVPLPSPNLLKRKILIKNKRLKPEVEKSMFCFL